MDTRSTPNNKIRKACVRIMVYVLMLMMLWAKRKTCTMVKYKRFGSSTFTVSRFLFSVAIGLMQSGVLDKTSTGSLALTLTIKDISWSLSCRQNTLLKCSMFQTQQTKDLRWLYLENDESSELRMPSTRKSLINLTKFLLLCHTSFRERGNKASIRVPRMFKSHV
jgi:hypothetical protein